MAQGSLYESMVTTKCPEIMYIAVAQLMGPMGPRPPPKQR